MNDLGELVKAERERQGIKAYALAFAVGETASWISRLEKGEMVHPPEPEPFAKLATALGLTERRMLRAIGYLSTEEDALSESFDVIDPIERGILKLTPQMKDADKRTILAFTEFLATRKP